VSLGSSLENVPSSNFGDRFYMERLVVDPKNPGTVYAFAGCDSGDGCYAEPPKYKSTDGGATWAKWELPESSNFLTIDPQGAIYVTVDVENGSALFKSSDGGGSWRAVTNSGLTSRITALAVDPQNPNHLFAGTGGGVFEITIATEEN
jgi:hypothetical protein